MAGRALPELAASAPARDDRPRASCSQEIDRQIAADGGHCERSTHYHRYTLDFYALALIVARQTDDRGGSADSKRRSRGSAPPRACSPTIAAASRTSATTMAAR